LTVCSFLQVGSISTYALFVGRDFPDGITCFAGPQRFAKVDLLMTRGAGAFEASGLASLPVPGQMTLLLSSCIRQLPAIPWYWLVLF
jgi:hypothetical protein